MRKNQLRMNNQEHLDGYGTTESNLDEIIKYGDNICTYPTDYGTDYSREEERLGKQGSNDVLYTLSNEEKYKFYERMARITQLNDNDSLAALLLDNWLHGTGNPESSPFIIPNDRIKNFDSVQEQMELHKSIYLSETSFKGKVRGVKPRLQSCLLYTSPSPRDRTRSRMPSSA